VTGSYADLVRCKGEGVNEYVYMMLPPDNPQTFNAMVEVISRPDLLSDDRFCTPPARAKNAAALTEVIEGWARRHDKRDVMKAFAGRGIPCGSVFDTAEVLQDEHLRERGTIVDLEHPTRGKFSTIISPLRLSDSPVEPRRAPLYGEHTEDVLRDLAGYSAEEVAALRAKGVIPQA
jgi:formyl-CoA transferase